MIHFPHDRFAKQFLSDLLEPLGTVTVNRQVSDETREIDLYFTPDPHSDPDPLGLLGRMVTHPCLLEPFRNPIKADPIRSCLIKQLVIYGELQRQAKRDKHPSPQVPYLWILTPTAPRSLLTGFGATANPQEWGQGIYLLAPWLRTALVVIHQLPPGPETLWLRLMGRGRVQQQAIAELLSLPTRDPMRQDVVRALSNSRIVVNTEQEALDAAERELIVNLSPVFLDWEEKTREAGRTEGRTEGRIEVARNMLQAGLDLAQIAQLTGLSLEQIQHLSAEINPD